MESLSVLAEEPERPPSGVFVTPRAREDGSAGAGFTAGPRRGRAGARRARSNGLGALADARRLRDDRLAGARRRPRGVTLRVAGQRRVAGRHGPGQQ